MDSSLEQLIQKLITQAEQLLKNVQRHRYDVDEYRALVRLEGEKYHYRIFITMIYRADDTARYAYHVLDKYNQHVHRFDNSADKTALKLRYQTEWLSHQYEEIPHQHDRRGTITLTSPMTFEMFATWLVEQEGE